MDRERERPTVQLLHELPDGTHHVDWMFAQDSRGAGPLTSFRMPRRLESLDEGGMSVRRVPDHRSEYLTYEGEVSAGRGRVRRLAEGVIDGDTTGAAPWLVEVRWLDGPSQRLRVAPDHGDVWRIEACAE